VDYLRNGRGATSVAPYSTRARPNAPVSAPIEWNELNGTIGPGTFTIENIPARLKKLKGDPWIVGGFCEVRQSISAAALNGLGL
jgi:bifunctional non-homologous end joining protein LigD